MKLKIFAAITVVSVLALIVFSQVNRKAFEPAEDFPRAALVYVQIADLPALIKLWNESTLKKKYLESENFRDFKNRHLGLKLASRWEEFNNAAGFPLDLNVLSNLTANRAAMAIYDIGKLEFVFIAPINDSIFTATKFIQNQDKFQEQMLEDGTIVFRTNVEADRGRQKQELIFTYYKGRFILATGEKLLAQTLANINGKAGKNSLSNEPAFKALVERIEPHTATVWVNQTALNEDYYFKNYWLMSNIADLKNIRAGVFDFSLEEGQIIEHRKFLLDQALNLTSIEPAKAEKSLAFLPVEAPFYRLQAANKSIINNAFRNTLFGRQETTGKNDPRNHYYQSFDFDDLNGENYSYLSENFDKSIDEAENEEILSQPHNYEIDFANLLQPANPQTVLTFTEPKVLASPLFVDFQHTAIFNLNKPANFNRELFESAVSESFLSRTLISAPDVGLSWETKSENDISWREISLPMLGLKTCYAVLGNELIMSNNSDFMRQVRINEKNPGNAINSSSFTELSVLNFGQRENAYDRIFSQLARKNAADDFFTENIKSLLDSAEKIKRVEVKRSYLRNFLNEQVTISLRN